MEGCRRSPVAVIMAASILLSRIKRRDRQGNLRHPVGNGGLRLPRGQPRKAHVGWMGGPSVSSGILLGGLDSTRSSDGVDRFDCGRGGCSRLSICAQACAEFHVSGMPAAARRGRAYVHMSRVCVEHEPLV